jgi:hypothetical protein
VRALVSRAVMFTQSPPMGAPPFRVGSWTKALPASGGGFRVLCLNILSAERNDCAPIKSIGRQRGGEPGLKSGHWTQIGSASP